METKANIVKIGKLKTENDFMIVKCSKVASKIMNTIDETFGSWSDSARKGKIANNLIRANLKFYIFG
jgi:hypothetical protein